MCRPTRPQGDTHPPRRNAGDGPAALRAQPEDWARENAVVRAPSGLCIRRAQRQAYLGRSAPAQDHCVNPLFGLTIRLDTLTGWKSASTSWLRQAKSASFQRESGVPMRPPDCPLSARIIP